MNTAEAIKGLFASASKAKRSKVRSFADIFEELGDIMAFPEVLSERRGLRLAQALKQGGQPKLREALTVGQAGSAEAEWAAIEPVIVALEQEPSAATKRGRPKSADADATRDEKVRHLDNGAVLRMRSDGQGFAFHISGKPVDSALADVLFEELVRQISAG